MTDPKDRKSRIRSLALRWAAISLKNRELPHQAEDHESFIREFQTLLKDDSWYLANYNLDRWSTEAMEVCKSFTQLQTLTELEMRELLTYFYAGGRHSEGFLESKADSGSIQRALLCFSEKIFE